MADLSVEQAIQIVMADMTGKGIPAPDRWATVQACWGIIADSMRPPPPEPKRRVRKPAKRKRAIKRVRPLRRRRSPKEE